MNPFSWLTTSKDETLLENADKALDDAYDRELIAFYTQAVKEASAARCSLMDPTMTDQPRMILRLPFEPDKINLDRLNLIH